MTRKSSPAAGVPKIEPRSGGFEVSPGRKRLCRNPLPYSAGGTNAAETSAVGAEELSPARAGVPTPRRLCVAWGG